MKASNAASGITYPAWSVVDRLADRFAFRRREEVEAYLAEHPELVPLLIEARTVIPRYVGPDAPVVLEVFADPEAETELRDLFAHIQSPFSPDETLRRLRQFDEGWWLNALDAANGKLAISVEPG